MLSDSGLTDVFICHAIRISPFCSNPPPAPSNAGAGFLETTKYP